jgi:cellulose synthase/poly-beta-1,6-N-acetylglucosamine synthase-like glycosyltransferase
MRTGILGSFVQLCPVTLETFTLCAFAVSVAVSLFYQLFFFARLAGYREPEKPAGSGEGVSVVVAAHNELENLRVLLPLLLGQHYPRYEIIVVDDRSGDGGADYLRCEAETHPKLRPLRIEETPPGVAPKKYAVTLGIGAAIYDIILLTDADCRPRSPDWIGLMAGKIGGDKEIVLGYSPYGAEPGLLNWMIRYETFYTAVQYVSFALAGLPYMGVGRNLAYRKSVFTANRGFRSHQHVVGGDDDLFVGETATRRNVAVSLHPAAAVESVPKRTLRAWLRQKKRHLAAGKRYRLRNQALLGALPLMQGVFWAAGTTLVCLQAFIPYVAAGFLARMLVQVVMLSRAAAVIDASVRWYLLPAFDFLYTLYYSFIGVTALFSKRIRWQ